MADDPSKEPLDSNTNDQPEPSNEIIPAEETETITPIQQTENMEVHKHPHHVTHKKKWTEYLLEFFMLFLAVFLGFVAENVRENIVEHERESQYMKSFVYDLKNDTANLNEGFPRKDGRMKAIDSVFLYFQTNPNTDIVPGSVLRFMRRSLWDRHYRRNSTTIDQLKNAGGLRLIRKNHIADSIAAYDLLWQRAEFWREGYITLQEKGKDLVHKIVNANELLSYYRLQPMFRVDRNIVDTVKVRINKTYLNEFLNFLSDQKITTSQDKEGYQNIEKSAEKLIALIKNEYRLE
ncbi:MAG: hypothetical protein JWN83_2033 [Chitinophagaceae bacterium]|nr:hypothetical protein [Chitinophagaceae bacterium]